MIGFCNLTDRTRQSRDVRLCCNACLLFPSIRHWFLWICYCFFNDNRHCRNSGWVHSEKVRVHLWLAWRISYCFASWADYCVFNIGSNFMINIMRWLYELFNVDQIELFFVFDVQFLFLLILTPTKRFFFIALVCNVLDLIFWCGMRADGVSIIRCKNFKWDKFKNALVELSSLSYNHWGSLLLYELDRRRWELIVSY